VTAASLLRASSAESIHGMRPIDPRHDMLPVARLIETSFAGELDQPGREMIREMKAFGRAGWLGWLVGRLFLPPAAYPAGYVWQHEERLIGNASLLPAYQGASRWVIANVAVDPEFRRQGIARQLVSACLDQALGRGADQVVLQVRHDNHGAITLYRQLGFVELTTRTTWQRRASALTPTEASAVRERRPAEWSDQWRLARELHPEGLIWPYPLRSAWFRPSRGPSWLRPLGPSHWVLPGAKDELSATVTARYRQETLAWRLVLLVPAHLRGQAERPLLARALSEVQSLGARIELSYPPGAADDELAGLGFRAERTLTWMGITLDARNRPGSAGSGGRSQ
jgi:ribosomal protein S18 acetylase RimI-like enzyme